MKLQKIKIKENVSLYYTPTKKFKTTALSFYFHRPLTREESTVNSLLCAMLRRACPDFPESKQLSRYLDNLYGVSFSSAVRKKGERQILCFNFQFVNDKFVEEETDILGGVLNLAECAVFRQDSFNEEYLRQEKENLRLMIMSVVNDKRRYASKKCIEIMCDGEPYGVSGNGYIEDIEGITAEMLINHYKDTVLKSPLDIFVTGDVDINLITEKISEMLGGITPDIRIAPPGTVKKDVGEVKRVTEQQQIVQGKLCIGFRTGVFAADNEYPALMMYNAILGCGIFSKLFNNVREKLSLCYYASSGIDYLKGIMTINSGIEVENFQKAYDEIFVQMKDIEDGKISDTEMEAALLGTVNTINSLSDNPFIADDYYLGKIISGKIVEPDELADKVRAVTKQQVTDVAKNIKLDTVFFLEGSENK